MSVKPLSSLRLVVLNISVSSSEEGDPCVT